MKKKLLTVSMMLVLFFTLASCDILSTLLAVKGFYTEYQNYSAVYNDATQYTVLTETDLTISDTNITDINETHARVYLMIDKESPFLYVEQTLDGVSKTSMYENAGDLYIEYLINDMVVTPTIPAAEDRYDGSTAADIFNQNFNYQDVQNELSPEAHNFTFDINLNQAINLDALTSFVDQLSLFGADISAFDNAVAHVEVTFVSDQSEIDVNVTLTDYTINFDDSSYVTLSLTNHTVLKAPTDFQFPDIFNAPYEMVAVDNIDLARRVYVADEAITYPATAGNNGWVKLSLDPGIYQVVATSSDQFSFELKDADQHAVTLDMDNQFTVTTSGTYYLYLIPGADFQMDISVVTIEDHSVTTTEPVTTALPVTTQIPTTTAQ